MNTIILPHKFNPRDYQKPLLRAMDNGIRRALTVWHRRSGKDKTDLNYTIKEMGKRVGQYYYYFPTMTQGRKILWDGIDRDGFKFMGHFPKAFISSKNDQMMQIKAVNGSLFQIVGTDRLEVVGPNPVGCVFSEFSLQNPRGWSYVRPILAENKGWAIFNFTPRGRNHAYRLYRQVLKNPDWFVEKLSVDDTGAVELEYIDAERRAGMTEGLIQQEFYCSFDYGMIGAYYSNVLNEIEAEGHFQRSFHDRDLATHIVLDPGYTTAVWLFQAPYGTEVPVLRYYEDIGLGIDGFGKLFRQWEHDHHYNYGKVFVPCDMDSNAHKVTRGETALDVLRELGFDCVPLPRETNVVREGIPRTEKFLRRCWFDYDQCELGIDSLRLYHEAQNQAMSTEDKPVFTKIPAKDGFDHCADAMRYMSMAFEKDFVRASSYPSSHTGGLDYKPHTTDIARPGAIDDESDMLVSADTEGAYTE